MTGIIEHTKVYAYIHIEKSVKKKKKKKKKVTKRKNKTQKLNRDG